MGDQDSGPVPVRPEKYVGRRSDDPEQALPSALRAILHRAG